MVEQSLRFSGTEQWVLEEVKFRVEIETGASVNVTIDRSRYGGHTGKIKITAPEKDEVDRAVTYIVSHYLFHHHFT